MNYPLVRARPPIIQMFNVKMRYPTGDGVENVNLTVRNGEFAFLVGPSGAGKSTILKLIYMEELPEEGQVIFDRYNSLYMTANEIPHLRRRVGVVFQDFKLMWDRDAYENVALALKVTGVKRREVKRRVLRALAEVGLSHKRSKLPNELSGGEQQRVAIARALVQDPLVILGDEPTGNLDPDTANSILDLLERINQTGTAVLMATHNVEYAKKRGKRIIRVDAGRTI